MKAFLYTVIIAAVAYTVGCALSPLLDLLLALCGIAYLITDRKETKS